MSEVRVNYACGTAGKMVAARILPGSDLLTSLEEICDMNGVKYGAVNCFGSFSATGYMYLVPMDAKVGAGYGDVIKKEGPIEFLSGTGIITQTDKGVTELHFHGTMCDKEGEVFGGHIVKGQCPVLTTVDVMIQETCGVEMIRTYDEETDLTQVVVAEK